MKAKRQPRRGPRTRARAGGSAGKSRSGGSAARAAAGGRTARGTGGREPPARPEAGEPHRQSPTAVALEAERTGVLPVQPNEQEIPGIEDRLMRAGDPDVSPLANEYSGEEMPGADNPTPDQSVVDEIGRAYGVEEADSDPLRASGEVLEARDHKRRGGRRFRSRGKGGMSWPSDET